MDRFKTLAANYLKIHNDHWRFKEIKELIDCKDVTPAEVTEELLKSDNVEVVLKGLVKSLKRKKKKRVKLMRGSMKTWVKKLFSSHDLEFLKTSGPESILEPASECGEEINEDMGNEGCWLCWEETLLHLPGFEEHPWFWYEHARADPNMLQKKNTPICSAIGAPDHGANKLASNSVWKFLITFAAVLGVWPFTLDKFVEASMIIILRWEDDWTKRVVDAGMFKGVKLHSSMILTHMFYVDDVVFVGQWCDENINTLIHVLECFYRASGMRINMSKSKIMGICVADNKIKSAATNLRCRILKTPFIYLGTKVGDSMARFDAWEEVINKVYSRLSKWKMKSLSIGGRLILLKSVLGFIPIFHLSIFKASLSVLRKLESTRSHFFSGHDLNSRRATWIKWNSVLAPKEKGGLGVSSLYALNRALMIKWVWRFHVHSSSLWARVIEAIHGVDGKIGMNIKSCNRSCWLSIVNEISALNDQGINLFDFMRLKWANGYMFFSFWEDHWIGDNSLKDIYPRLYALENNKHVTVSVKLADDMLDTSFRRKPRGGAEHAQFTDLSYMVHDVNLGLIADRWVWSLKSSGGTTQWWDIPPVDDNSYEDWSSWLHEEEEPVPTPTSKKMKVKKVAKTKTKKIQKTQPTTEDEDEAIDLRARCLWTTVRNSFADTLHPDIRGSKRSADQQSNTFWYGRDPEHFGPRCHCQGRRDVPDQKEPSFRSKLDPSSGSSSGMFQEMLQQQYELERKMKQDVLERESRARVDLLESQKIAEDMRVLTMDTSSLDPMNAANRKAQQARSEAKYQRKNNYLMRKSKPNDGLRHTPHTGNERKQRRK
ncbi:hypothetical protein Tco_0313812 [Tanacetum coccineum]